MFPLLDLPNELLILIGDIFESTDDPSSLFSLILTSRHFANLFALNLNKLALRHPEPGIPILEWAITHGNESLSRLAFGKDCSPIERRSNQRMVLQWAAAAEHTSEKIIKFLLDNGAELEPPLRESLTPLHIAAFYGREKAARILLEYGANPRSQGPIGEQQPLYLAVKNGHQAVVEMLLEYGATAYLSGVGVRGENVLHLATKYPKILKILLKEGGNEIATEIGGLSWETRNSYIESVRPFIEAHIEAQHIPTPLHLAIMYGQEESTQLLLEHGADITARSNDKERAGYMALHLAAINGNFAIAGLLLEHGAEINACTNKMEQTALHLVATKGDADMIQWLLDQGININSRDEDGMTALHWAVVGRNGAAIEQLIRNHADTMIQDSIGRTALQLAQDPLWVMSKPMRRGISLLRKKHSKALASINNDRSRNRQIIKRFPSLNIRESARYLFGKAYKNRW